MRENFYPFTCSHRATVNYRVFRKNFYSLTCTHWWYLKFNPFSEKFLSFINSHRENQIVHPILRNRHKKDAYLSISVIKTIRFKNDNTNEFLFRFFIALFAVSWYNTKENIKHNVLSFVGGRTLEHKEIIKNVISANGGIAKLSALTSAGVPKEKIYKLCADGYLQRVRQGYYQLADELILSDEQVIASTIPEAIISMESALFRYGYSDFMPRVWSVTVPRSASRRLNTSVPMKVYYVKDDIYDLGKTTITENGVTFAIYDRERTICDMFKHRGKVDNEMFSKAVNAYANDTNKNLKALSDYAKKLRVYKKVMELMEVLLNG